MTDLNQMPRIISRDVNIEEKNVNIDNVNSRNINSNDVNCTDKSYHDKGLINCTNVSRTGQEGVTTICRSIVMCVELLKEVLTSLKCVLIASVCIIPAKHSQLKGWKQHKTACDAIIQLKVDESASACKTGIYNRTLPPSE